MSLAEPRTHKWTVAEYYRMADAGLFQDQRVELVEGEIIEMAPQKNEHAVAVMLVDGALRRVLPKGHSLRIQLPMRISQVSEPEPDVALVRGLPRDLKDHPRTALLVVEVSDTTLDYDRTRKASLYASAGVGEYWIVNLLDRCLEVHRNPIRSAAARKSARYGDVRVLQPEETIAPLGAPRRRIAVADLLP